MTNWTDLIDTDPVGAANLYLKEGPPPIGLGVTGSDGLFRLVSNLAALCEELSGWGAAWIDKTGRLGITAKSMQQKAMQSCLNEDGSRRFPEVK